MTTVGAYEAKTHLPRLLDRVEAGETVIITKHGREVARLVPPHRQPVEASQVIDALKTARGGVRHGPDSVRSMVDQGRR